MPKIGITDYLITCEVEQSILGNLVGLEVNKETEVLMVWHEKINEDYILQFPNIRGVQRYGVGFDNLDLEYLCSKGITCCNNPDYGVDEVSDTAIAMILNISRRISQYNESAKSYFDSWQENTNSLIKRSSDIVVGVLGAGRIGSSVILKCNALKFQTIFFDPYKESGYEKVLSCSRANSIDELLSVSDIISIHTPLNKDTIGLVDEEFLSKTKDGVSIVNTARGKIFKDMEVLYNYLMSGRIDHLATDVLPVEPPEGNSLIEAWRHSLPELNGRLIINPHTAYYSQASYREMRLNAAKNALKIFNNQEPLNRLVFP